MSAPRFPTLALTLAALALPALAGDEPAAPASLYEVPAKSLEGQPAPLEQWKGKVVLVVNVASQCGFTGQYKGLQALHARLAERGFAVLAFPSNEFGGQEPGDAAAIRGFCEAKFQVTFPMFEKCKTQAGEGQSPVYAFLGQATGKLPSWNFCKYLVGRDGKPVAFYPAKVPPDAKELLEAIEKALAAEPPAPQGEPARPVEPAPNGE
jgi:glutathione peroxidase